MFADLFKRLASTMWRAAQALHCHVLAACKPPRTSLITGTLADLPRTKPALIFENALLRQQLIILQRGVKRPRCTPVDRALLVLLASRLRSWCQSLLIVQPDTLLRWHRALFTQFWRRKSRVAAPAHRPPIAPETISLIHELTAANRTWGAERIRGELLKLHIQVAKSTIQRYMRGARPPRRSGQTWATFLANHGHDIWAADFLPITDLLFRHLYAFFVIEIASRRVVHVCVTRHPTDAWVAQQLREATPFGQHPKHLIVDNDSSAIRWPQNQRGLGGGRVASATTTDSLSVGATPTPHGEWRNSTAPRVAIGHQSLKRGRMGNRPEPIGTRTSSIGRMARQRMCA